MNTVITSRVASTQQDTLADSKRTSNVRETVLDLKNGPEMSRSISITVSAVVIETRRSPVNWMEKVTDEQ